MIVSNEFWIFNKSLRGLNILSLGKNPPQLYCMVRFITLPAGATLNQIGNLKFHILHHSNQPKKPSASAAPNCTSNKFPHLCVRICSCDGHVQNAIRIVDMFELQIAIASIAHRRRSVKRVKRDTGMRSARSDSDRVIFSSRNRTWEWVTKEQ